MKKILLTGASGGLGTHLANYLLSSGYYVYMLYHHDKTSVMNIMNKYPNTSSIYEIDITNEEEIKALHSKIGDIDILINCAGIDHVSELEDKNMETLVNVFKVNTGGPFLLIKYFGKHINEVKGNIINISSDNTIDQYDEVTLEYDISKSGLNMLTKICARTLPNAHVNALAIGWLDTKMNNIPDDIKSEIKFVPFTKVCDEINECLTNADTDLIITIR